MGYESRIYIVRKGRSVDPDIHKRFSEVLAVFNLGKVSPELEDWYRCWRETDCYIYADDDNTEILEDCYGDPLREIDMMDLKRELRNEMRRYYYCRNDSVEMLACYVLPMLISKYGTKHDRIVCLHYGC